MKNVLCDICNEMIDQEDLVNHARSHRDTITYGLVMVARAHPEDCSANKLLGDIAGLEAFLSKIKGIVKI